MRYVECGEIRASALGFGCGSVMGRVGRGDSLRAMHAAWDAGVTLFDTARSYGYGEAEALLGEFLPGKRDKAVVVTKFGIWPLTESRWKKAAKPWVRAALRVVPSGRKLVRRGLKREMSAGHFDVASMRRSLEESLRALRTEYVDVLLMHEAGMSDFAREDLMAELEKVVDEGKARRVGSSSTVEVVERAMQAGPGILQAFQFPANLFEDGLRGDKREGDFLMANHPFGGEARTLRAQRVIAEMREDAGVDAELREKLGGNVKERLAEVVFGEIAAGADVVVPSMLRLGNLRANLAAMESGRFTAEERKMVRARVVAGG